MSVDPAIFGLLALVEQAGELGATRVELTASDQGLARKCWMDDLLIDDSMSAIKNTATARAVLAAFDQAFNHLLANGNQPANACEGQLRIQATQAYSSSLPSPKRSVLLTVENRGQSLCLLIRYEDEPGPASNNPQPQSESPLNGAERGAAVD